VPLWVDSSREVYFITVCCESRGQNQLARPPIAEKLFEAVAFRHERHAWFTHLFLIMPDHIHALLSFPPSPKPLVTTVLEWKRWVAKTCNVVWQRDFFEHRLRSFESHREKADYILANPVRAGLVNRPEDWPYVWFPETNGHLPQR
jgi:putative transposase